AEILRNNPDGPYILGGYSFGGLLVYEMARQLVAMGKEIKMLAVIDTDLYFKEANEIKRKPLIMIKNQFLMGYYYGKSYLHYPKLTFKHQLEALKEKLQKLYLYKTNVELVSYQKRLKEIYLKMYHKYQLTQIDLQVDLLRCKERVYFVYDKDFGWNKYTTKGVKINEI